jgi:hypothetical protein
MRLLFGIVRLGLLAALALVVVVGIARCERPQQVLESVTSARRGGPAATTAGPTETAPALPEPTGTVAAEAGRAEPTAESTLTRLLRLAVYAQTVQPLALSYANALRVFTGLNAQVVAQPDLIIDDAWRGQVSDALAALEQSAEALAAVEPVPPDMRGVGELFKTIHADTQALRRDYQEGVDRLDRKKIEAGFARIQRLKQYVDRAIADARSLAG